MGGLSAQDFDCTKHAAVLRVVDRVALEPALVARFTRTLQASERDVGRERLCFPGQACAESDSSAQQALR